MVGSLDHTSPLSLSLSSEGLSASLRSVTEIKNLQALVVQPSTSSSGLASGVTTTTAIHTTNNNNSSSGSGGQSHHHSRHTGVSDDIPVPGTSQHHHS